MIELAHVLLAGLGGWRLAFMLTAEDGPLDVFERVRRRAGVPRVGELAPKPLIGGILSCVYCCSVWTTSAALIVGYALDWRIVGIAAAWAVAVLADGAHTWATARR